MITLQSLTQLQDGRFYAKWIDADDNCPEAAHTIAALHHADGRLDAANFNIRAPRLTDEQMSQAQPEPAASADVHPAYELAAQGTAVRPDWANRYQKAAELVEAGRVRLTGPETAVVSSSQAHTITTRANGANGRTSCTCKWGQFNSEPCSHIMAMRMARALGQAIESPTARGMKRTIDVDTMWTNIYRQHNREQYRRRANRYDRHSRTRRQTAVAGGGD